MAQHRGVVDWLAIAKGYSVMGFEHSADVFCHHCGTPSDSLLVPELSDVRRLSSIDAGLDQPRTDAGVVSGND